MVGVVVISRGWAALLAFATLGLLLLIAHVLIVSGKPGESGAESKNSGGQGKDKIAKRRRGVKALVVGSDERASTSKVQAVLWTFAVFFAFVFLLIWGRSFGCSESGLTPEEVAACNRAADHRTSFSEIVSRELQADYYVLLGFPLGAAVAAKALTTAKVTTGTLTKTSYQGNPGVAQGLREVVSNDAGETDLLDFQYFAFNLLTLAFFLTEFLTDPAQGLPDLPATLIALSGLSAAAYTTKKALQEDVKPAVSSVIPRRVVLSAGSGIAIIGTGFGERRALEVADDDVSPPSWVDPAAWVKIDGEPLKITRWGATRIDAVLTDSLLSQHADGGDQAAPAELVVDTPQGQPSHPVTVELIARSNGVSAPAPP